jgi:BirA family biotin operon repressor/biotin-[acetyl-CoA-carboxylase] ligase
VSVLLRPTFPLGSYGWLPLIAGLAMARAVDSTLPELVEGRDARATGASTSSASGHPRVAIKWPNDVQIDGLKVSGLLAELLPAADGVVIGAGLNLAIPADGLPTATSTSLNLHGAEPELDEVLAAYLRELATLYSTFAEHGGDAESSGIRLLVQQHCSTIGEQVRVELPGGKARFGTATGIDAEGRLVFTDRADASVQSVAAGDVTHLRYE